MTTKRLAAIVLALALIPVSRSAAGSPKRPQLDLKGVRILVCAGYFDLMNIPAIRKLTAAGADVRAGNLAALTWDTARKYHLIIVVDEPPPKMHAGEVGPVDTLTRFVKQGGGVLFFCQYTSSTDDVNRYLAPFDATLLREFLQDPQRTFKCPTGFNLPYAYTENIAQGHPVTRDVSRVWYNIGTEVFHTSAIDVSKDWQMLVSGEASATTLGMIQGQFQGEPLDPKDRPPGEVPEFAADSCGEAVRLRRGHPRRDLAHGGLLRPGLAGPTTTSRWKTAMACARATWDGSTRMRFAGWPSMAGGPTAWGRARSSRWRTVGPFGRKSTGAASICVATRAPSRSREWSGCTRPFRTAAPRRRRSLPRPGKAACNG